MIETLESARRRMELKIFDGEVIEASENKDYFIFKVKVRKKKP